MAKVEWSTSQPERESIVQFLFEKSVLNYRED